MSDTEIIIEVAKLDGWTNIIDIPFRGGVYEDSLPFGLYGTPPAKGAVSQGSPIPSYLTSRGAIIPVIEKQNFSEKQWEEFLRLCVPNEGDWIACNVLFQEHGKLEQSRLPRAYRKLVLINARQLCIALLKATGKYPTPAERSHEKS